MRAGLLRHTVAIQAPTVSADSYGAAGGESWSDVDGMGAVPASIAPASATETIDNQKIEMRTTHQIRIRYRSGVNGSQRIKFGSRYFKINSILNWQERNIYLDLSCEEIV